MSDLPSIIERLKRWFRSPDRSRVSDRDITQETLYDEANRFRNETLSRRQNDSPVSRAPEPLMRTLVTETKSHWVEPGGSSTSPTTQPPASTAVTSHPLQPIKISDTEIRIRYGTLAGAAPDDMNPGDDPIFVLTVSGDGIIYGKITRDTVTSAILTREVLTDTALPADDEENGHIEICSFSTDGDGILHVTDSVNGSQAHNYCQGHQWGLV